MKNRGQCVGRIRARTDETIVTCKLAHRPPPLRSRHFSPVETKAMSNAHKPPRRLRSLPTAPSNSSAPLATRLKQAVISLGIVVLAVFNSAGACPDPVSASDSIVVESMSLQGWGTTFVGDTAEIAINAKSTTGSNMYELLSVWTIGTGSVARLVTEGVCGKVDCATFAILSAGSTVVTATARVGKTPSGVTPSATTSLTVLGRPARVRFVALPAQMRVGETIKLTSQIESATGEVITSRSLAVVKSAVDVAIASGAAVTSEGPDSLRGVAPGLARVRSSLVVGATRFGFTGPAFTDEASIRVIGAAVRVILSQTSAALSVSQSASISTLVTDAVGTTVPGATLTATSAAPTLLSASVGTNGTVSLIAISSGGKVDTTVRVTVVGRDGANVTSPTNLDVRVLTRVTNVAITPTSSALPVGGQLQAIASVSYGAGLATSPPAIVEWRSDNPAIASVSPQGLVSGLTQGETVIRAIAEGVAAVTPLSLRVGTAAPRADSIAFSPNGPDGVRTVGQIFGYAGVMYDQFRNTFAGATVTWRIADPTIARVLSSTSVGYFHTVSLEALRAGTTTIVPESPGVTKTSPALTVTVGTAPPVSNVARIEIEPRNGEITAPATQQYRVLFYNAANERITGESGGSLQFASSNTGVASVDVATGLASGVAGGTVTITARYLRNGQFVRQDATPLIVYPIGSAGHYGSAAISTNNSNTRHLRVGETLLFQLIVRDAAGNQITSGVTPVPTVTSLSTAVVTIAPTSIPGGYFYNMVAASNAAVGTVVTIRYDIFGAGGEIRMTIVP